MKRRDLLAHLSSHGCELVQEGAKHSWWENPANGRRSAVPRQHQESTITAHLDSQDLRLGLLRFRTGFPRWLCWRSAGSRLLVLGGHPTLEFGNNSHCGVEELFRSPFNWPSRISRYETSISLLAVWSSLPREGLDCQKAFNASISDWRLEVCFVSSPPVCSRIRENSEAAPTNSATGGELTKQTSSSATTDGSSVRNPPQG